jgi:hypothetical protein
LGADIEVAAAMNLSLQMTAELRADVPVAPNRK